MSKVENETAQQEQPKKRRKMRKGWKITLISLASLIGLLLIVAIVALWLVLTPARLTSIVNRLSDKFILCENNFEDVDLTLIKTFPYVGLDVEGVTLINHVEGTPNDTLAKIASLSVGINLREFLRHSNIEVTKLVVEDAEACLFTNNEGVANYDIFPASDTNDTTPSKPFEMPELVSLQSIRIKNLNAGYVDQQSNMSATVGQFDFAVDGRYEEEALKADMRIDIGKILFAMKGDSTSMDADLDNLFLKLKGDTKEKLVDGKLEMSVENGKIAMNGQQFVNEAVDSRKGDLIMANADLSYDLDSRQALIDKLLVNLKGYELTLNGTVNLPKEEEPLSMDLRFATNSWGVNQLLAMLPAEYTDWQNGMSLDANATLTGSAVGQLGDSLMPAVIANLKLVDGRFSDRSLLPYGFTDINADLKADLNLNDGEVSNVDITRIAARTGRNTIEVSGHVEDLLGKMNTDARLKGTLFLPDVRPMLPDDMNMRMDGKARFDLRAVTNIDQLQKGDFAKMKVNGDIALSDVDVEYDTIFAKIPQGNVNVQLPSKVKRGQFAELLSAVVTASGIEAKLPNQNIDGTVGKTKLTVAINDIFDSTQPFRVLCDFDFASLSGTMDSMAASLQSPKGSFSMLPQSVKSDKVKYLIDFESGAMKCEINDSTTIDVAGLAIKGGADYDPSRKNTLWQWSPNLDVDFKRGYIDLEQFDYMVQIPDIKFNYRPERCEIASANVVFGNSDFYLSGAVTGLEKWLSHEDMLKGDLYFTSNYTNVDDLLEAFSGMGTDADTLERQRKEDNVDTAANPFIVPRDVDFTLHTRIKEATAFDNDLREVAGDVQIRDGVAVLNQVGFVCKAARMQLTGMYRTPRVNHIFVGMDFHLLDINIQELIEMIPYVDTLVPLLSDLEGNADFHLCAETYVNAYYKPKMSTLRAAGALTGQNLVVLDNKDIDRIAKLLQLKRWREDDTKIHVDSLDVAMTVFRKELEVYPFLLSLHKYQIVAEGRHNLDNNYDYHVELVESPLPVRLAVDVFGTLPNLKFDLSPKLRYKNLYRPAKRDDVDKETLRLKAMIRESLEANVKESTREYQGISE